MIFPKSFYDIDFTIIAERLLPPSLRQGRMLSWLKSLLQPLQELRNEFFDKYYYNGGANFLYTSSIGLDERLKYNSQTALLEFILNKQFGIISAPYIYIVNNFGATDTVYLTDVNVGFVPIYFGDAPNQVDTIFIGNEDDYLPPYDFTVYVPMALYTTLGASNPERDARVQFEVNKYKLTGINNNIIAY